MRRSIVIAYLLALSLLGVPPAVGASPALAWRHCPQKALKAFDCATLTVPRDYADPAKGTFDLAVVRLPATGDAKQRKGTIFFNPGGPGLSPIDMMSGVDSVLPRRLRKHFDFVTWDPRGVGRSSGLNECNGGEYRLPATGPVDWDAVLETMRQSERAANQACARRYPDVVPYISTNATVRDLDRLRIAVGDKKLTYWGTSYGTRIGFVYAHDHPQRIRAMLLTSPVDPQATWRSFVFGSAIASDTALGLVFEAYPGTAKKYRRAMRELDDRPLNLPSGPFTRWSVGMVLAESASSDSHYKDLAAFIDTVDTAVNGAGAQRRAARKALDQMGPWPETIGINGGAITYIGCSDYADRFSPAEQDALARRIRAQAPMVGYATGQGLVYCEGIDVTPDPVPVDFTNWNAPMLIMGSTRDALTPYAWVSDLARTFRNSRVVTLVGGTHTPYLAGSKCADRYGTDYLVTKKRPRVDVACKAMLP